MNNRSHSSVYTHTGIAVTPMMKDDKEKHDSELLRQMHSLLIAFLFTGLDFRPHCAIECRPNVAYRETLIKILLAVIHISSWVYVLVTIYGAITNGDRRPIKHSIANRLEELLIILMRGVLYWRHKDIANTLNQLSNKYDKIKHKSKYLDKSAISVLVVVFPGVYILAYGLVILSFFAKGQTEFMYFVRRRFSNVIPTTLSPYVYYLLCIIDFVLLSVFNTTMCLFIILILIICTTLSLILKDFCKSINSFGATFKVLKRRHVVVMNTVKKVDKCLSFPLFIFLGFHIMLLFFVVAFFNSQENWVNGPSAVGIYFCAFFIVHLIQYFVIMTFAANVHEEVQNIKTEVAKMDGRPTQLADVEQLLLIAKINNQSNICLTLCGFLNITKNFVFSSFGALLTFGVLLKDL
ncbi:uncharacterized protein NPIL_462771 [Nephila pilipes]|uniref:Uncharacterized protein n=1 Tax=Nephila pilipes TaxID=299642 RepID=A0A8X6P3W4_NEPPI|nr:uncharacterized protein NPIL_462771 [Nephila pilipes]